jgi:uncharacterized membrane protein required for colicin V production
VIYFRVMTSLIFFLMETTYFFLHSDLIFLLYKRQYKNFVILHKEIFEKKKINLEKINFITNKNKSKTVSLST